MKIIRFTLGLTILLSACNNSASNTSSAKSTEQAKTANTEGSKGAFLLGTYHAYQSTGSGFNYQYPLTFLNDHQYKQFDDPGEYSFDPATNGIRFTSGPIKDFTGVFTRVARNNENRKPMIVIDFKTGAIPDTLQLDNHPNGYYQYAFLQ